MWKWASGESRSLLTVRAGWHARCTRAWRKYFKASAECRRQQWNYLIVGNNLRECLNSGEKVKSQPSWDGRLFRKDKLNTCSISQHGQHGKPAAPKLHCPSEFCKFQLVMDFGCPGVRGVLFGIIKQMWHPCGVANMVVYPSWALSPSGYALGWQCSLGVDNHVSNPAGMSYLYNSTTFLHGSLSSKPAHNNWTAHLRQLPAKCVILYAQKLTQYTVYFVNCDNNTTLIQRISRDLIFLYFWTYTDVFCHMNNDTNTKLIVIPRMQLETTDNTNTTTIAIT